MKSLVRLVNGQTECYINPDAVLRVFFDKSNLATAVRFLDGEIILDDRPMEEVVATIEDAL